MITTELAGRVARATLAAGGATMALDGTVPVTGYAVALEELEHRYPSTDADTLPTQLAAYVDAHRAELELPGRYLGTWVADDGTLYVDVSEVYPELEPAMAAAYDRGQLAIFDLTAGAELLLTADGSGEVVPS